MCKDVLHICTTHTDVYMALKHAFGNAVLDEMLFFF